MWTLPRSIITICMHSILFLSSEKNLKDFPSMSQSCNQKSPCSNSRWVVPGLFKSSEAISPSEFFVDTWKGNLWLDTASETYTKSKNSYETYAILFSSIQSIDRAVVLCYHTLKNIFKFSYSKTFSYHTLFEWRSWKMQIS